MTENEKIILKLLKRWPSLSKNVTATNKKTLAILLKGLAVLDEDEKKLLWDVYYLKNNDVELLREFHGLGLPELQEKQSIILGKMEEPILAAIEEETKKEHHEKRKRDEEKERKRIENEAVKKYLNQLEHFDLEMDMLNEKYKDLPYVTRDYLVDKEFNDLLNNKMKISNQIEQVPNTLHRILLGYRYVIRKPWKEIGRLLRVSEGHAMKMHAEALQSFKEIIEKEQSDEPKHQENEPSFMDRELRARQERFHKRTESDKSDNERERYVRHFK